MKTALVTGGSRGIGKAIVYAFANAGYNVLLNYNRSEQSAKDIVKDLEGCDGVVEMFKADVTNRDEVDAMVEYAVKEFGGIDVVALGSDFDGIENKVEISDVSEMGKLAIELEKEGFTTTEIEKIYYKNALRVIKDVL